MTQSETLSVDVRILTENVFLKHVQTEALERDDLKTLCVFTDVFGLLGIKIKVVLREDEASYGIPYKRKSFAKFSCRSSDFLVNIEKIIGS